MGIDWHLMKLRNGLHLPIHTL